VTDPRPAEPGQPRALGAATSPAAGRRLPDPEQIDGLADMDPEAFRAAGHLVVDRLADYLDDERKDQE